MRMLHDRQGLLSLPGEVTWNRGSCMTSSKQYGIVLFQNGKQAGLQVARAPEVQANVWEQIPTS